MSELSKFTESDYNEAVERVRHFLAKWHDSGVELFKELRMVEDSGVWKQPGHASFSDFLRAEFPNALGIDRYRNVIRAIDLYGEKDLRKWGVHNAHAITVNAVASQPDRIEKVRASLNYHIETQGVAPDVDATRNIVKGIAPELRKPHKTTRQVTKLNNLQQEVREKNKKVRELEKVQKEFSKVKPKAETLVEENKRLKAKIKELEQTVKDKNKLIRSLERRLKKYEPDVASASA